MSLEKTVARLFMLRNKTIAIAESCTGGLLTHRLTNVPGSSHFLKLAVVAYSNEAKTKLLKIPSRMLRRHGAVSRQTAAAMARAARAIHKTDFGVGITGIAGPAGATKTKPVGMVYIAVNAPEETVCLSCRFRGNRLTIKRKASTQALRLLKKCLS